MSSQRVAVVVLNWNGWQDTLECIESLLLLDNDAGIVVCDNASADNSMAQFRIWAETRLPLINKDRIAADRPARTFMEVDAASDTYVEPPGPSETGVLSITLIQTGANLGFAGGNNVGLRYAIERDFDYFWILNNDTRAHADSLTRLLLRMQADPDIGICGSTLVYMDAPGRVQCLGGGSFSMFKGRGALIGLGQPAEQVIDRAAVERRMRYVSGAAMLVSRAFMDAVGLMYEGYFLYFEEIDWATRGRGRFKLGYAPDSIILHKVGATIGTKDFEESSPLSEYYMASARVKFCARFAWQAFPFVMFDIYRDVFRWCLKGRWARARMIAGAAFGMPFNASAR